MSLIDLGKTREQVCNDVLNAILTGHEGEIRRSEWKTAVIFLNNRNRDQEMAIKSMKEAQVIMSKERKQQSLL